MQMPDFTEQRQMPNFTKQNQTLMQMTIYDMTNVYQYTLHIPLSIHPTCDSMVRPLAGCTKTSLYNRL